jgi:hypothetical protein
MSSSSASSSSAKPERIDPVLRNALRYTVSPKEYQLLHQYLLSRAPAVRKRTLAPRKYEAVSKDSDDYNAAAIRVSLRLAVVTFSGLKAWELITTRLLARGAPKRYIPYVDGCYPRSDTYESAGPSLARLFGSRQTSA